MTDALLGLIDASKHLAAYTGTFIDLYFYQTAWQRSKGGLYSFMNAHFIDARFIDAHFVDTSRHASF